MYNRIIIMGRLTRDPELKTTQSGISACRISVAVDRQFANKSGEKEADFFEVQFWRQSAEFVSKYWTKGKLILVEGWLQNNNYTDQSGVKHYTNVIVADRVQFCGDKQNGGNYTPATQQTAQASTAQAAPAAQNSVALGSLDEFEDILSDGDTPF